MRATGLLATVLAASATALPHLERDKSLAAAIEDQLRERQDTCSGPTPGNPSTWWRAAIEHNGTTPYSSDDTFQYYRTAVQYGADPTGKNDSSEAFNFAIEGEFRHRGHSLCLNCCLTRDFSLEPNGQHSHDPSGVYLCRAGHIPD